jgi:hypothetical protein
MTDDFWISLVAFGFSGLILFGVVKLIRDRHRRRLSALEHWFVVTMFSAAFLLTLAFALTLLAFSQI